MVMIIISIILASLAFILVNTIIFNSLINDFFEDEINKTVKIILFIPPLAIITSFFVVLGVLFIYIIESFKKISK
jgi:hypothetical protein